MKTRTLGDSCLSGAIGRFVGWGDVLIVSRYAALRLDLYPTVRAALSRSGWPSEAPLTDAHAQRSRRLLPVESGRYD